MNLLLATDTTCTETLDRINGNIPEFATAKKLVVPTAANGYGKFDIDKSYTLQYFLKENIKYEMLFLEDYLSVDYYNKLLDAEIIILLGGLPGYLAYWARRINLKAIFESQEFKNKWLIGSSAGAMVCSPTLKCVEWDIDGDFELGASCIPGLGLENIDFEVFPHYKDEYYDNIKKHFENSDIQKLALLKNNQSIIIKRGVVDLNGIEVLAKPLQS